MFWISANDCVFLMIYLLRECLVNKLNYGILQQLPATSGHIKSKQHKFNLIRHPVIVMKMKITLYQSQRKITLSPQEQRQGTSV